MSHEVTDFETDVLQRSQTAPVLVDFWAAWCGPCKMLAPILDRLAADAGGRWSLVKVDTEAHPNLATRFQIRGIPNLKLFHRGEVIAELAGALPEPDLRQWLEQHLPTAKRETMARARQLLLAGRAGDAARLLQPLADAEAEDQELAVLLARALAFGDPAAAAKIVLSLPTNSPWEQDAQAVLAIATALGSQGDLLQREPPSSRRDTYAAALRSLQAQDFAAAAERLTEVLLEDVNYDRGRAKAACAALFKHLGLRHPISDRFHRRFSMAVNA